MGWTPSTLWVPGATTSHSRFIRVPVELALLRAPCWGLGLLVPPALACVLLALTGMRLMRGGIFWYSYTLRGHKKAL